MPQAWTNRMREPYIYGRVKPCDSVKIVDTLDSSSNESSVYYIMKQNVIAHRNYRIHRKPINFYGNREGCCDKCINICKFPKFPLLCMVLSIVLIILALLLVFGLAFGLTYYFQWQKKEILTTVQSTISTNIITTPITTVIKRSSTRARKVCKNLGMFNLDTFECDCREFTFGEFCENGNFYCF
jgi:hypothetical protein